MDDIIGGLRTWWDKDASLVSQTDQWMRERGAAADEIARLRNLLGRYSDHVGDEEGTDFLNMVWEDSAITEAEAKEIASYSLMLSGKDDKEHFR